MKLLELKKIEYRLLGSQKTRPWLVCNAVYTKEPDEYDTNTLSMLVWDSRSRRIRVEEMIHLS